MSCLTFYLSQTFRKWCINQTINIHKLNELRKLFLEIIKKWRQGNNSLLSDQMEPSVILFTGPFLFFFTSFPYTHIFNSSNILKIDHAHYGNSWQFSSLHFQHIICRGKNCLCLYQTLTSLNHYINFSHFTGWGFANLQWIIFIEN